MFTTDVVREDVQHIFQLYAYVSAHKGIIGANCPSWKQLALMTAL